MVLYCDLEKDPEEHRNLIGPNMIKSLPLWWRQDWSRDPSLSLKMKMPRCDRSNYSIGLLISHLLKMCLLMHSLPLFVSIYVTCILLEPLELQNKSSVSELRVKSGSSDYCLWDETNQPGSWMGIQLSYTQKVKDASSLSLASFFLLPRAQTLYDLYVHTARPNQSAVLSNHFEVLTLCL